MNSTIQKFTFWIFPVLAILFTGCKSYNAPANGGVGNMSGLSGASKPLAAYECSQTKGNVRVTLLKVQRGTIFTSEPTVVRDAKPGQTYPVPALDVAYRVEALGNEPIKAWNLQNEEFAVGNRKIPDNSLPENIIGGSSGVTSPAGNRAMISENQLRAAGIQSGEITVTLTTGFNDHNETFVFANVPLN